MSEKRYRVQVIDQARNLVLLDATSVGSDVVVDLLASTFRISDFPNSLHVRVDQLASVDA
jgi:hypothetical protein